MDVRFRLGLDYCQVKIRLRLEVGLAVGDRAHGVSNADSYEVMVSLMIDKLLSIINYAITSYAPALLTC